MRNNRLALIAAVLVVAVVPVIVVAGLAVWLFDVHQKSGVETQLRAAARSAIASADAYLGTQVVALEVFALTSSGQELDSRELSRRAGVLLDRHPTWNAVAIFDSAADRMLISEQRPGREPLRPDHNAIRRVLSMREPLALASSAGQPTSGSELVVQVYVPVFDARASPLVAVLALEPRPFSALVFSQNISEGWIIAILDPSYVIVGRSRSSDRFVGTRASPTLTAEIDRAADSFFFSETKEGARVYTAFSTSPATGWTAAIGAPEEVALAAARRSTLVLSSGAGLSLVLAVAVTALVIQSRERQHAAERRLVEVEAQQRSEQRLADIAANFPGVIYRRVLHPDGRISYPYVSEGLGSLIGDPGYDVGSRISMEEFGSRFIMSEDREPWADAIRSSARDLTPYNIEGRLRRSDSEVRWVRSIAQTRIEQDGTVVWDGVVLDVTDQKKTEAALQKALAERETLLREVHHRVKNNLQVILSVIRMESSKTASAAEREKLQAIAHRVQIFARIHQQLYQSDDLARVDLVQELQQLCRSLQELHHTPGISIRVKRNGDLHADLACSLEVAIPLALLVNELVTNSLKHAFQAVRGGEIIVSLGEDTGSENLVVTVADNGTGLDPKRRNGTGQRLMAGLAAQIGAVMRYESNGGTIATIIVPIERCRTTGNSELLTR